MSSCIDAGRRRFVSGLAYTGCCLLVPPWAGRLLGAPAARGVPLGVQAGDVTYDSAVLWSACDRTAQMAVRYATNERLRDAQRRLGPLATPASGGTAKLVLTGLPPGQEVFYEVRFLDPHTGRPVSDPVYGRLRTPARDRRSVSFLWSGDTVGQGWGINPDFGGLKIYESMRRLQPDFFIHSGDLIYADIPLQRQVPLPGGGLWRNLVTEEKSRPAQTLEDFRGCYRYNLMDEHLRRFCAEVPQYVQWDDHEVSNNWYPGRVLDDPRRTERRCEVLVPRARQAFAEFTPLTPQPPDRPCIHRVFHRGPLLDLFLVDLRSFRGPNSPGRQRVLTPQARILGAAQAEWLKQQLRTSTALWKVIAADMSLGLVVADDGWRATAVDGVAQGDPEALGRELEIAELLSFLRRHRIYNVVWLTADVHYAATHRFDPGRARFSDFDPFYEFVSGPLHAGPFGPNQLDATFGPQLLYQRCPPQPNLPPSAGYLHFGHVHIDGRTGIMTVSHRGLEGQLLHRVELVPQLDSAG
ncbi:MAG: alkaline phosphatase D family protein [Myxococcales bacterium]|nr:alkaline phosphatase D family protein [Myxococcota bacterium]MDW8283035.1 alkaline phosphatase D family protein [Myxococcales bacterium]